MRRVVGICAIAVTCLATTAGFSQTDPRVTQVMNTCRVQVNAFNRACGADRDCVRGGGLTNSTWEQLAARYLEDPAYIAMDRERNARYDKNLKPADRVSWYQETVDINDCIMNAVEKLPPSRPSSPSPAPTPAPRSPASPAPKPPDLNEARQRVMQGYKDAIDDVLAELDRLPAMRKNAPPPPKGADAMKDTNTRGEDAVECLGVFWPANLSQPPRLQNHCAFPVEALWCVRPCGKHAGNMWTIYPSDGNYSGYPILGTENAGGRSSVIWFGGCKGRNSIGDRGNQTYSCGPPY